MSANVDLTGISMGRNSFCCRKLLRQSLERCLLSRLPPQLRTPVLRLQALLVLRFSAHSTTTRPVISTCPPSSRGQTSTDQTRAASVKVMPANFRALLPRPPLLAFRPLLPTVLHLFLMLQYPNRQSPLTLITLPLILGLSISRLPSFLLLLLFPGVALINLLLLMAPSPPLLYLPVLPPSQKLECL
jgi:hypothetical protein